VAIASNGARRHANVHLQGGPRRGIITVATETLTCCISQIGQTAGEIWHLLDANGPMTTARLVKEIDAPRDLVMQAVGWLAREDKIDIEEESRTRVVSLRTL
jgi:hypothetical protein